MDNKIIMVRSPRELVNDGVVGYGWDVNFSQYNTSKDLLESGFKGKNIGRKTKQIKRFFDLKKDDIVVVPVSGAIAIGVVEGNKTFVKSDIPMSSNRVKVNFYKNKEGKVIYVPRVELVTNLERRLKIRTSIADLESFRIEIEKIAKQLDQNEIYTWDGDMIAKEEEAKDIFIDNLEKRLRTEKGIGLAAGGYGLELLIKEIFEAKGYSASIPSKNSRKAGEDVDIIATKEGELGAKGEKYFIQAKHHRGTTGRTGLDQLVACKDDEDDNAYIYKKILMTTASVSEELKKEAIDEDVIIIEGIDLAKWVYDNITLLSKNTLMKLGISEVPTLL